MTTQLRHRKTIRDVDTVAMQLIQLGEYAKKMPPAYRNAGICEPVYGFDGIKGMCLDGEGLLLGCDLADLGITKPLPHVFERSKTNRLIDRLKGDVRGAITTYDGIVAARASGAMSDILATKTSYTTVANVWSSTFRAAGTPPAGTYSNIPGGAAPDETNAGAISSLLSFAGSATDYLISFGMVSSSQINCLLLVDLVVAAGNISATTASSQTVNTTALTRYTNGEGLNMTFDVTTPLGTSTPTMTITYTNQAGTGSRTVTTAAMTASAIAQRLMPTGVPFTGFQSGDFGVRSVQSVQLSGTMTAGVMALNIWKQLAIFPGSVANIYAERPMTSSIDGLVELVNVSNVLGCITAYALTNTTTLGTLLMKLGTVWG